MPLLPGKENIGRNIAELTHHGSRPRSHAQIVAIALSNADRHPHKAGGGGIGLHPGRGMGAQTARVISPSQGTPWWVRSEARNIERPIRTHLAAGGIPSAGESGPWWERSEARIADQPFHSGLINSSVPGRTDRLPLSVGTESHIVPSDAVSGAAQGNSLAGARIWQAAIRQGPWGIAPPKAVHGKGPPSSPHLLQSQMGFAEGGQTQTSILAAGGEIVIPPEDVEAIGERAIRLGRAKKGESAIDAGHRMIDEAIAKIREFNIKWLRQAPTPKR